ncbi:autotransporter outer membrane beta-barrel domain-containing protein [Serratia aquatilis]|uniref:Autotransporter outer membrane beta-barrel domain-containing protein n=1 Tax=Serratia aquatilis TaxID=1737515 RepID=A0ABV6EBC1_9GAMM
MSAVYLTLFHRYLATLSSRKSYYGVKIFRQSRISVALSLCFLGLSPQVWAACGNAGAATVINSAETIKCSLAAGESLEVTTTGVINAPNLNGVEINVNNSSAGGVSNAGTIASTSTARGIEVDRGTTLNGGIVNTGSILAQGHAIEAGQSSASFINASLSGLFAGIAIYNNGLIQTANTPFGDSSGIRFASGSIVTGEILNTSTGNISGVHYGINFNGTTSTLNGNITNEGNLTGGIDGIINGGLINGNLTNTGLISSGTTTGSLYGIYNTGTITGTLASIGTITGAISGIYNSGSINNFVNNGTITGLAATGGAGLVYTAASQGATLTNSGTITGATGLLVQKNATTINNTGTIGGTAGTAVSITGNNNALILGTGSILNGSATSTGTGNTLELQGASSVGSNITGFNSLTMSGTNWTLGGNIATTGTTIAATNILNGILTITGALANSGAGGGTTIASGATLQVGNNGTSGTIAGDVVNNGTLTFNRSDDSTYDSILSGVGQLFKQGAGVLTLTGGTARQESVEVQAGTLRLNQVGDGLITTGDYTTQAGATTSIGLSSSIINVGGVFTQAAGSTLNATLGASPDITAATAQLDGTLIVNGFAERDQPTTASSAISLGYILLRTTGGISGDFDNNPLDSTGLDYLLHDGHAVNGDLDYELGFRLAWQEGGQAAGTGNFTLNEGTAFDIDIALANQAVPVGGFDSGWDGQSLVKLGAGRLLLSAQNSYAGSTTVNDGVLQFNVADSIAPSSGVIVNGGVLDLNGYNQQFNRLAGSGGEIQLKGASLTAINASAADDSLYAGNITGDGTFIKSGAGNLTLSGNTAWVGNTELQGGGLILDGSTGGAQLTGNIIGQSGTQLTLRNGAGLTGWIDPTNVTIDTTSYWDLTANSLVNNLSNSGTVTFAVPTASDFKTLTVEGDYQGNNGLLVLNTSLGDDTSLTDKLIVNGNTTAGTTRVQIANAGGSGAQTLNGIEVVAVGGQSDGEFVQTGRIVAGAYDYTLGRGTAADNQGNWYLTSKTESNAPIQRPEASGYAANLSAANNMFVTRLHDRLGETEYIDAMTGEKKLTTLWLRNEGGHNRSRDNHDQLHTQANRYVLQIGGDIAQWSFTDLDRLHLGIMAGYANSKSRTESGSTNYSARASVDGYSTGVYGTWYANEADKSGLYVDSWLQYSWFNNTVDGQDLNTEEYKSKGVTASVESGYSFKVGESAAMNATYFIQPKAQVIWMGVKADDHREANGTQVSGEGNRNIQTLLGVKAFMNAYRGQDKGKELLFKPFVEVNWIHNTKDFGTNMDGVTIKQDGTANIAELKVGADGQINKQLSLWGDVGQQIGNKGYSDTAVMLGVKYSF